MHSNQAAEPALLPVGWAKDLLNGGHPGPIHGAELTLGPGGPTSARGGAQLHVALNTVQTLDGRAAINGTAAGLGSPSDRRLMQRIRCASDAIMHGAATLRAEQFTPQVGTQQVHARLARGASAQPLGIVLTGSGDLPASHPYFTSASPVSRRLIYAGSGANNAALATLEDMPGVSVVRMATQTVHPENVLDDLAERGVRTLVCEGGPSLNGILLASGLVNELFVTVAPRLAAGWQPVTAVRGPQLTNVPLRLRSAYLRQDELFLRYLMTATDGSLSAPPF